MARININGTIIGNTYGRIYQRWGFDVAFPAMVQDAVNGLIPGETLDVHINSGGGEIFSGSEIYTILRNATKEHDVKIHIDGLAASAASVIAMASHCDISPTGMMMVHDVSTCCRGNHRDMAHTSEMLRNADNALCTAYMAKTGMSREKALEIMDYESWYNAEQAKELGLVDEIMFNDETKEFSNSFGGTMLPSIDKLIAADKVMSEQLNTHDTEDLERQMLLKQQKAHLDLLVLSGKRI